MARLLLVVGLLVNWVCIVNGQTPNILCILEHCSIEMVECMADTDCRKALTCVTSCGANQTCAFICLNSYEDTKFDSFIKCAVTDHHCVTLAPPDHPFNCTKPTDVVSDFRVKLLQGEWYNRGHNPIYDCFNCQVSTYSVNGSDTATVIEKYDVVTIDGEIKHKEAKESVTQKNVTVGGVLLYKSSEDGLPHEEEWRILDYPPHGEFILAYYCGNTESWKYEGAVLYSKTPILPEALLEEATKAAAKHGFDLRSFCSPKTTDCGD